MSNDTPILVTGAAGNVGSVGRIVVFQNHCYRSPRWQSCYRRGFPGTLVETTYHNYSAEHGNVPNQFLNPIRARISLSLQSSHASLISHPTEVAQLILNATKGITKQRPVIVYGAVSVGHDDTLKVMKGTRL